AASSCRCPTCATTSSAARPPTPATTWSSSRSGCPGEGACRISGVTTFPDLVARARGLVTPGRRALLGIVGGPGSGKSTLAEALLAALRADPPPGEGAEWVAHVPMDGYH